VSADARARRRAVIVARIKPGSAERVAAIFGASDATELPRRAGVVHRSLFVLGDVYVHLVESEGDLEAAVAAVRDHPEFVAISTLLAEHIEPLDPETWRSPRDAFAREFYRWDSGD